MINQAPRATLLRAIRLARGLRRCQRIVVIPLICLGVGIPIRELIMGLAPSPLLIVTTFAFGAILCMGEKLRKRALQRIRESSDPSELSPLFASYEEAHTRDSDVNMAVECAISHLAFHLDREGWAKLQTVELDQLKALLDPRVVNGLQLAVVRNQVLPPWLAYLDQDPWWSGWRQGSGEWWLCQEWLPFWRKLDGQRRAAYLADWEAPAEWREYLDGAPQLERQTTSEIVAHVLNLDRFQ